MKLCVCMCVFSNLYPTENMEALPNLMQVSHDHLPSQP